MNFATLRTALAAASMVAVSLPAGAQQDATAVIPTDMEERVLVQLVQLPLIARDRQGRPVVDLRKDEIEVTLRGRPMTVSYLERLAAPIAARGPLAEVRLFLDAPGGWSEPVRTTASQPRYLAFFLDGENDDPLRRDEALTKTIAFVDTILEPEVRVAVFSYDGALHLELPFTTNRDAVKSSLSRASARQGRPRTDRQARMRQLLSRMDDCIVRRSDFGNEGDPRCMRDVANEYIGEVRPRSTEFIRALDGIVGYLSGLKGHKSVYVLSHGVPVDPAPVIVAAARGIFGNPDVISEMQLYIGFGDEPRVLMDRLLKNVIKNRVSLSFMDRASPPSGDFQASRGPMLAPGSSPMRAEYEAAVADMEQIAYSSGGVHVRATDVSEGLRRVADAERGAYELGFQTGELLDPDKLSKIVVTSRRRGVKITHRRGLYAEPPQLDVTLAGGFRFGKSRPLTGDGANGIHQPFVVEVDPAGIGYEIDAKEARSDFTVHVAVQNHDGSVTLVDTYHLVNHTYDRVVWDADDRAPVTLTGWVELPPGQYTLMARFRNVKTGREGAVRKSVAVRGQAPPP